MDAVKCKVTCQSKTLFTNNVSKVAFSAVTTGSKENEEFFKWTPSINFDMSTLNEAASEFFAPGEQYIVTITRAEGVKNNG